MGKPPKGSSSTSTTAKAGKKSGSWQAPPAPNAEKQDARLLGQQQFVAKEFPQPLPSRKGAWDEAMDALCSHFNVRRIRQQRDDTGIRYDASRKRYVMPPNRSVQDKNN